MPKKETTWTEWPIINDDLLLALENVIRNRRWALTGYWSGHESYNRIFEKTFAEKNEISYCTTVTSGSTALMCALEALGIGIGDQVIIPALTWVATATAVLNVNAEPVLVDVDPKTYCIDPDLIEQAISNKTKAIIAVHLCGTMADMDKIMHIAGKYNIKVIEDNAQTHFSKWKDKYAGTIGDIGTFSFQQGKILTSGEGGAVVTDNYDLYMKIQQLRCDARAYVDHRNFNYGDMEVEAVGSIHGTNYNLSEFQAAILLEQLKYVDSQNCLRNDNAKYLTNKLKEINGISLVESYENNTYQTYYGYPIKFDSKVFKNINAEEMTRILSQEIGLGSFYLHAFYPAIHKSPLFCPWRNKRYLSNISRDEEYWRSLSYPIAESANKSVIFLLHSLLLSDRKNLDMLVDSISKIR